jgi:hypothetical protein
MKNEPIQPTKETTIILGATMLKILCMLIRRFIANEVEGFERIGKLQLLKIHDDSLRSSHLIDRCFSHTMLLSYILDTLHKEVCQSAGLSTIFTSHPALAHSAAHFNSKLKTFHSFKSSV